jgi:hypothetical protein
VKLQAGEMNAQELHSGVQILRLDIGLFLALAGSSDLTERAYLFRRHFRLNGDRGVRIFDSANSNFEKVEKFDSNSNWQIGIPFARIAVLQNSFMKNSKARSNIREKFAKIRCKITG